MSSAAMPVAVVGGGVCGLATALQLADKLPHLDITVISDRPVEETTSFGAGGLWEPYQIDGTSDELINRWGVSTFQHLLRLMHSEECAAAGVQLCGVYSLFSDAAKKPAKWPAWHDIVFGFRDLSTEQIAAMGMPAWTCGFAFDTIVADQTFYLRWLHARLGAKPRVSFQRRTLASLHDLSGGGYSAIFNCAGLGSLNLVDDATCYPIRGQVMRMKAPWVKHVYMFDERYYVIPNVDTVVVGGTAQRGDFNQTVSDGDAKDIHSAVTSFLPSLKAAPIAYQWAGLRPGRMGVRLEREDMVLDGQADGQAVAVIHNYGHGGSGITLHWGCVEDAINLAANALSKPAQQANARSRM